MGLCYRKPHANSREKMAFFTTPKTDIPEVFDDNDEVSSGDDEIPDGDDSKSTDPHKESDSISASSRSSTLKHAFQHGQDQSQGHHQDQLALCKTMSSGFDLDQDDVSPNSSTCSTPTPHAKGTDKDTTPSDPDQASNNTSEDLSQRFTYEIDPDIGVIV